MKDFERLYLKGVRTYTDVYDDKDLIKMVNVEAEEKRRKHQAFLKKMHMTEEQYQELNKR